MKDIASSACSSGGCTATMSSTTASLMLPPSRLDADLLMDSLSESLMKYWALEELGAVGRGQRHIKGNAFMMDSERHIDAGRAKRPEPAVEIALSGDLLAVQAKDHVACLQLGTPRWAIVGDADNDEAIVDLGRIHAKPGPRRLVDA